MVQRLGCSPRRWRALIGRAGQFADGVFSFTIGHSTKRLYYTFSLTISSIVYPLSGFVSFSFSNKITIRSSLPRVFGGALAVAPVGVYRSLRRLLTTMASMAVSGSQAQNDEAVSPNNRKTKLHGRAFYESIGSPKLILAPMVEQSEFVCLS